MKKKFFAVCVCGLLFSGGVFVASCDDIDNRWITLRPQTETAYVISCYSWYLVAVSSLDEGTVSTKEKVPK